MTTYADARAAITSILYTGGRGRITPEMLGSSFTELSDSLKAYVEGRGSIRVVANMSEAIALDDLYEGDIVHVVNNGEGTWSRYQVVSAADGTWTGATKTALHPHTEEATSYKSRAAAMLAVVDSHVRSIRTGGYYQVGDGGGALYKKADAEPSHGAKFQSADGAWWELCEPFPHLLHVGGVANDVDDMNVTHNNNAITWLKEYVASRPGGGELILPAGVFRYDDPQAVSVAGLPYLGVGRLSIRGAGSHSTQLRFRSTTPNQTALSFSGTDEDDTLDMYGLTIEGIALRGPGPTVSGSVGLHIDGMTPSPPLYCRDLLIYEFETGLSLKDVVGGVFVACDLAYNKYGHACATTFVESPVNELSFIGCHWIANRERAGYFFKSGPTTFIGGSAEGNGEATSYGVGTDRCGFIFDNCGLNTGLPLTMKGFHFENNGIVADVWIKHGDYGGTYRIDADFYRVGDDAENYVQNHVRFDTTGASRAIVSVHGSAFKSFGYTPSASRRVVAEGTVTGTLHSFDIGSDNHYDNLIEIPDVSVRTTIFESGKYAASWNAYTAGVFVNSMIAGWDATAGGSYLGNYQNNPFFIRSNNLNTVKFDTTGLKVLNTQDTAATKALIISGKRPVGAAFDSISATWELADSGGTVNEIVKVQAQANGNTAGSVTSRVGVYAMSSGTLTASIWIAPTAVYPNTNGGVALGAGSNAFVNLYLYTGSVLNIGNGNWVATHSSGILTVGTGDLRVTTAGTNAASVVTVGGTQTLDNKTLSTSSKFGTYTVATLPAAATAGARAQAWVTDASVAYTSANLGSIVAGGGANLAPVYSDNTQWRIG